jgi:vancomycin resistance protein YoaR
VFITPPKFGTDGTEMVAKVEKNEAPAQTAPTPAPEAVVAKAEPIAPIASVAPKAAPLAPKATKAAAKPAIAAPAKPEAIEPAVEHVLAAATTAPNAVAEEKMVTMSERDIPITRPENYKYTPEELAQLKKQAAEAYFKWVELELEISKNNLQQTAQN